MARSPTVPTVRLTEYLLPFRKPFATARQSHSSSRGFIVEVSIDGYTGLGEANPRRFVTGERFEDVLDAATTALQEVADNFSGLSYPTATAMKAFTHHLRGEFSTKAANGFPSLTLAIEMALLDLHAKRTGQPLYRVLAPREEKCFSSNAFTSNLLGKSSDEVQRRAKAAGSRRYLRTKLSGSWDIDGPICATLFQTIAESGSTTSVWFDLNESLQSDWYSYLTKQIDAARTVGFDNEVVLEQPTPRDDIHELKEISNFLTAQGLESWAVMADESVVDMGDLERICALNEELAVPIQVNIKPQKVGSLLDAVDMADRLREVDEQARVYFGGIIGSTDLSGWATFHLNHAAHNTGFSTAYRKRNYRQQLCATPLVDPRAPCPCQDIVGLGTMVERRALERVTTRVLSPQPTRRRSDRLRQEAGRVRRRTKAVVRRRLTSPRNDLVPEHVQRLREGLEQNHYTTPFPAVNKKAFDSYLLHGASLRAGLPSRRTRQLRFATLLAERVITFHWTAATYRQTQAPTGEWDCFPGLPDAKFPRVQQLRDKEVFRQLLRESGLPYVPGFAVDMHDRETAVLRARELEYPLVLKPAVGTGGVGVTTNIQSTKELEQAWDELLHDERAMARNEGFFVVERHIDGLDARAYLVHDSLIAFNARQPATLTGDGSSSAQELLEHSNHIRRQNPHLRDRPLRMNAAARDLLTMQGFSPKDVLPSGVKVRVAKNGNLSQGGESLSLLDRLDAELQQQLAAFLERLQVDGLRQCGLDLILTDTQGYALGTTFYLNEANSSPGLGGHQFPMFGPSIDVGADTLQAHANSLARPLHDIRALDEVIDVDIHTHTLDDQRWLQLALQNDDCRVERVSQHEDDSCSVTTVRGTAFEIVALYSASPDRRDRSSRSPVADAAPPGSDQPLGPRQPLRTWTFLPH